MSESEKPIWKDILSLLIIGFGIGWLAGISISPVASIIISALLGIAISIVGITSLYLKFPKDGGLPGKIIGIESAEEIKIGAFALLVVGIVAGVSVGIYMRVNRIFVVEQKEDDSLIKLQKDFDQLQSIYDKLKKDGETTVYLGLKRREIALRILDKYYPKSGSKSESAIASDKKEVAGLMAGEAQDACSELLSGRPISSWRNYIKTLNDKRFEGLDKITDDSKLEEKINDLCDKEQ